MKVNISHIKEVDPWWTKSYPRLVVNRHNSDLIILALSRENGGMFKGIPMYAKQAEVALHAQSNYEEFGGTVTISND